MSERTHSHFDAGGEDGGSEREGVGTDWSDDHAGDTGVDHTGPCCQRVGRAACRGGDDDPWEGGKKGGGQKEEIKLRKGIPYSTII